MVSMPEATGPVPERKVGSVPERKVGSVPERKVGSVPERKGDTFAGRVASREAVVGVMGLGYVGLPLAIAYAEAGFHTIGFDVDRGRVESLLAGSSHVDDVSAATLA